MPFGSTRNPVIPGYGRARKPRPDLGSSRQRRRRKEVAGPYRGQSSNPAVRAKATPSEHRTLPAPRPAVTTPAGLSVAPSTFTGPSGATLPSLLGMTKEQRDELARKGEAAADLQSALENWGSWQDDPSTLEALEIASLGVPGLGVLGAGAKLPRAISLAEKLRGASSAVKASEAAVKAATTGRVRGAVGRAAARAEPGAVRAARQGVARGAGRAAAKVPKPVRTAGKVAGTAASLPIKRPFTAPIAAQVPAAAVSGDPTEFGKAFTGEGSLAAIASMLGNATASVTPSKVAQNLVRDAFNLPAVVLPSIFLPAAGLVEASQGDSSRLRGLWDDYVESGAIPAALRGDAEGTLRAIESHPLFSALEASGGAAIVGRGAGALARGATGGRVAGTERPPVHIKGYEQLGNVNELMGRGRYSPDLIRQIAQRVYDARRGREIEPRDTGLKAHVGLDPASRALKHTARRFAYGEEQLRRVNRSNRQRFMMKENAPTKGRFGRVDRASAGVVAQAVQRIGQRADTFAEDLPAYRAQLEAAFNSGRLTEVQKKANRAMVAQIDKAIHSGNPEEIVKSANAFIEEQGKIVTGLVERGLLNEDQAIRAALFPWARVHMDADYKPNVGLVDRSGNPLKTEAILASMERQGVDPPGFLSQKPRTPGAGAYFQPAFPERQSLRTQPRTGKATLEGTYDASYQALTEQLLFAGSKLDAAKTFDKMIRQFGTRVPEKVTNMREAWDAIHESGATGGVVERFGWQDPSPQVGKRPVRVAPFLAAREEIAKAQGHQGLDSPLLDPAQAAASEALSAKLLKAASDDGPGPYAYIPEIVFKELEGQFKRSGELEKVGQVFSQLAKSAWLPFSPPFYIGNMVDNFLRATFSGIGPSDVLLGRQAIKGRTGKVLGIPTGREPIAGLLERDPAAAESIVSGAGYSSVVRGRIHRDARQFEGTALQSFARGLEALGNTHGPKEALWLYRSSRDLLLGLNSKLTERLPQYGAVGNELRRDLQAKTGQWRHALMVGDDAFKDLLDGLRGTDKQIQYARAVEQVFSNWGKVGRAGRALGSFAPFWQWARAANRFVFLTLPAHHPIKTGLIAAAAELTEEERKRFGLDQFAEEPLPPFLQGSLPFGGGIAHNLPKYTSFGVFSDPGAFLARIWLPQLQGPSGLLEGIDWKGEKLAKADGTPAGLPERVGLGLLAAGSQFIPGLNLLESATGISLPGNVGGNTGPEKFLPWDTYTGDKLDYFRSLPSSQQITVPASGSGGSSRGVDYGRVASGGRSGAVDYGAVATGGR